MDTPNWWTGQLKLMDRSTQVNRQINPSWWIGQTNLINRSTQVDEQVNPNWWTGQPKLINRSTQVDGQVSPSWSAGQPKLINRSTEVDGWHKSMNDRSKLLEYSDAVQDSINIFGWLIINVLNFKIEKASQIKLEIWVSYIGCGWSFWFYCQPNSFCLWILTLGLRTLKLRIHRL